MAQMVKSLPTIWETWVQPLGWEDLLENALAVHSSILAWRIPWMEEPGRLQSMGSQSRTRLSDFTFTLRFTLDLKHYAVFKNKECTKPDSQVKGSFP